jgi:hypothetical protein
MSRDLVTRDPHPAGLLAPERAQKGGSESSYNKASCSVIVIDSDRTSTQSEPIGNIKVANKFTNIMAHLFASISWVLSNSGIPPCQSEFIDHVSGAVFDFCLSDSGMREIQSINAF